MKHLGYWRNKIITGIYDKKYYVVYSHKAMFIVYKTGNMRINSVYQISRSNMEIEEYISEFEDFWLFGDDLIFELTEDEVYRHILCEVI